MGSDSPLVTVLMSVYNGEKYLCESIDSILNQTFHAFELVIINDGSTDDTEAILSRYLQEDKRIRLHHQTNKGLIAALNKGLEMARGEYIARIDADDVCNIRRMESQIEFFKKNPEVGILGTNVKIVDEKLHQLSPVRKRPTTHHQNMWRLLFDCPLMHPSVMFRKSLVEKYAGYKCDMLHAEDYELWSRLGAKTKICQIPDVLVYLRKHGKNIGSCHSDAQESMHLKIACRNVSKYIPSYKTNRVENVAKTMRGIKLDGLKKQNAEEIFADMTHLFREFVSQNQVQEADFDWIKKDFCESIYAFLVNSGATSSWRMSAVLGLFSRAGLLNNILYYFLIKSYLVKCLRKV